jgi:putative oxidoreductase
MKTKVDLGARIVLGLIMLIFGLNGFFNFLPMPPPPEHMMKFVMALMETGYFMQFVKACEVICGILLLANVFVPLSLLILAPIAINIFLLHVFMAPEGLPIALIVLALGGAIAWARFDKFSGLLKMK